MKNSTTCAVLVLLLFLLLPAQSVAQELPYKEGSVWAVQLIRTKTGMTNEYIRNLAANSRVRWDEAKKQGLILSYKILLGSAANKDDWDIMIMAEYKNMAALDGDAERWEAIAAKSFGSQEKTTTYYFKLSEIRDHLGVKYLREINLK